MSCLAEDEALHSALLYVRIGKRQEPVKTTFEPRLGSCEMSRINQGGNEGRILLPSRAKEMDVEGLHSYPEKATVPRILIT